MMPTHTLENAAASTPTWWHKGFRLARAGVVASVLATGIGAAAVASASATTTPTQVVYGQYNAAGPVLCGPTSGGWGFGYSYAVRSRNQVIPAGQCVYTSGGVVGTYVPTTETCYYGGGLLDENNAPAGQARQLFTAANGALTETATPSALTAGGPAYAFDLCNTDNTVANAPWTLTSEANGDFFSVAATAGNAVVANNGPASSFDLLATRRCILHSPTSGYDISPGANYAMGAASQSFYQLDPAAGSWHTATGQPATLPCT